ncbi:MAG TPA: hypothetical protein VE973_00935, partial [Candidatus Limnocylindria bacterium]|nr:hypothetical protein [Candidatus Limnocylindria bacterium]
FKKITSQHYWFYVKAVLVIIGGLGIYAARETGEWFAESIKDDAYIRPILNMHHNFANITTYIFTVVAIAYLITWVNKDWAVFTNSQNVFWKFLVKISGWVLHRPVIIILALAGLAAVTITGGLGGAMAFGPDADPFFHPVFNFLMKK